MQSLQALDVDAVYTARPQDTTATSLDKRLLLLNQRAARHLGPGRIGTRCL
jgi:hypothetical protein